MSWEVSLRRAELVEAEPNAPTWHEVYQLFLQQLAAGWVLEWAAADGHGQAHRLPNSLALGILDAGGFAFLSPECVSLSNFFPFTGSILFGALHSRRLANKRGKLSIDIKIRFSRRGRQSLLVAQRRGCLSG